MAGHLPGLGLPAGCLVQCVNIAPYVLGEMSESRAKRVRIKEVDGWTLRMLIDYVYTAEIQVTEENVQVRVTAHTMWFFTHGQFSNAKEHTYTQILCIVKWNVSCHISKQSATAI